MKSAARLGAVLLGSVLTFVACGDDEDNSMGGAGQGGSQSSEGGTSGHLGGEAHGGAGPAEAPVICQVLGELCHEADTGSGTAHECHELGHVGDQQVCEQEFDGCIATCVETGGGEGGAGGGTGAALDPYCAALGSLCHPIEAGMGPECHEIGHLGVAADCAEAFEVCGSFCLAELEKLEQGAGGASAGGAGPAAGGAGPAAGGAGGAQ